MGSKALPPCSCAGLSPGPASATTVGHDPLAGCAGSEASAGIVRSRSGSEAGDGSAYKRRWELGRAAVAVEACSQQQQVY